MNEIEEIVTMLPRRIQSKIEDADCTFSDGCCESLSIIGDYIKELHNRIKELEAKKKIAS